MVPRNWGKECGQEGRTSDWLVVEGRKWISRGWKRIHLWLILVPGRVTRREEDEEAAPKYWIQFKSDTGDWYWCWEEVRRSRGQGVKQWLCTLDWILPPLILFYVVGSLPSTYNVTHNTLLGSLLLTGWCDCPPRPPLATILPERVENSFTLLVAKCAEVKVPRRRRREEHVYYVAM